MDCGKIPCSDLLRTRQCNPAPQRQVPALSRSRRRTGNTATPRGSAQSMISRRTRGIVLSVSAHGESDKLVTFYSPDLGRSTGIAKGAKRSKQRFVNKLEEFSLLQIMYRPSRGSGLLFLSEAELDRAFLSLRRD
ncbi:MAG: DNA repair protein RecO, partial [Desulfobulbaceae bacterium]|nr:DNA repair protein RecO [Desulfobulbaceae bacterium]